MLTVTWWLNHYWYFRKGSRKSGKGLRHVHDARKSGERSIEIEDPESRGRVFPRHASSFRQNKTDYTDSRSLTHVRRARIASRKQAARREL
jgi:hypothetical protein